MRRQDMVFNSLNYVLFLTVALAVWWGLQRMRMARLTFLTLASCFFYMCSRKVYIVLLMAPTLIDYTAGLLLGRTEDPRRRKAILAVSLTSNLALLGTFKYYDFLVKSVAEALQGLHLLDAGAHLPLLDVLLPVGISFYTFETMAYVIDVYRRRQEPVRSPVEFALFITFFPKLVAGPIVLTKELVPQFHGAPAITVQQVGDGFFLILRGLVKKVAIADWLALNLVDRVYAKPEVFTGAEVFVALVAYSMQIYCDFSGYTDIARGSAKLFGFELPENFARPYLAQSVAHFWRRWHMTLSRWVREYIYFPLGGTHRGQARAYFNLVLTLVIMGLWHGANWTFFWYGLIHGVMVGINRFSNQRRKRQGLSDEVQGFGLVWRIAATFLFVTLARILFRSQDMHQAWTVTKRMLEGGWHLEHLPTSIYAVLAVSYAIHWTPKRWIDRAGEVFRLAPPVTQGVAIAAVGAWMVHLANVQPVPFIYFQF